MLSRVKLKSRKVMNTDYNIFLCYRGDKGGWLASNIYSELKLYTKDKLKLFFAPKCIGKGENFKVRCEAVAGDVSLMILILSPGFFDACGDPDDIVMCELRAALSNDNTKFLPIIMPGFDFKDIDLTTYFSDIEIDRIGHINPIKYTDVYSFSSTELLAPIFQDRLDYNAIIKPIETKKRSHITHSRRNKLFSQSNTTEINRLKEQQKLLLSFDMPAYEKLLAGKSDLNVLDLGCGNGTALMSRLGNRPEVGKIIGIEFDADAVNYANTKYGSDTVKFYVGDLESDDFENLIERIMEETEIEKFDFINMLAIVSHLKSPSRLFKIIKRFCKKGAVLLVRNIDDGMNIFFPDDNDRFRHALSLLAQCEATGYRYSGRELYTIMARRGYKNITLERCGLSTVGMSYEERSAFFDVIFKFIKQGIKAEAANTSDAKLIAEQEWLEEEYDEMEDEFLSNEFFMLFGFILYTATVN